MSAVVGLVASAAGGVEKLREGLVLPLLDRGYDVAVTLTPNAMRWLTAVDEVDRLEQVTCLPVRSRPRLPGEVSGHPKISLYAAVPASANTVAKLALGIGDNQALTTLCENIGTSTPMIVFPRVNAAHARQPSWGQHLQALRAAEVQLVYGDDVWPLHEPREAPSDRELPWSTIADLIERNLA